MGRDGDVVWLHLDIAGARWWAKTGEAIVRIRVALDELEKIRLDSEQFYPLPEAARGSGVKWSR